MSIVWRPVSGVYADALYETIKNLEANFGKRCHKECRYENELWFYFRWLKKIVGGSLLLAILTTSATSASAQGLALDGRYVRVTRSLEFVQGGRETGELVIWGATKRTAKFKLAVSWDRLADDDGSSATLGAIEESEIILKGNKGQYIAANKEDKDLGVVKSISILAATP